jgi:hypothetical protein
MQPCSVLILAGLSLVLLVHTFVGATETDSWLYIYASAWVGSASARIPGYARIISSHRVRAHAFSRANPSPGH